MRPSAISAISAISAMALVYRQRQEEAQVLYHPPPSPTTIHRLINEEQVLLLLLLLFQWKFLHPILLFCFANKNEVSEFERWSIIANVNLPSFRV